MLADFLEETPTQLGNDFFVRIGGLQCTEYDLFRYGVKMNWEMGNYSLEMHTTVSRGVRVCAGHDE